jgi:hypothetical protein
MRILFEWLVLAGIAVGLLGLVYAIGRVGRRGKASGVPPDITRRRGER